MELSEAEIQVLASLRASEIGGKPTDEASLREHGECYWIFLEDWSEAFPHLTSKELIQSNKDGYALTDKGRVLGDRYHSERPNMYWYYYQRFYPAAYASAAHSSLCERVFGMDLCQEGQVDMAALHDLMARLALTPEAHVLDLGCGAGVIARYISEQTGARVTGLDYSAPAIAEAVERNRDMGARLTFQQGDMNALDLPARTFDAVISLDTLYWVADLPKTLGEIAKTMKPGGQMGIFISQELGEGDPPAILEADNTELAQALKSQQLRYDAYDYTAQNAEFWRRIQEAATDLREEFEAEGNGFIAASLLREAEEEFLPATKAGTITRYLYHVAV